MNDSKDRIELVITATREIGHGPATYLSHIAGQANCVCKFASQLSSLFSRVVITFPRDRIDSEAGLTVVNFERVNFVGVNPNVKGALVSALWATQLISEETPFAIFSGNARTKRSLSLEIKAFALSNSDGATVVANRESPEYAYVDFALDGSPIQLVEKRRASKTAALGLHFFRSKELFLLGANEALLNNDSVSGNFYVSAALNYILASGGTLDLISVDPESVTHDRYGA